MEPFAISTKNGIDPLTLAFLDPYGFHFHYPTFEKLAKIRCDLIVYLGDNVDVVRNWKEYAKKKNSNLDHFFGTDVDWRSALGNVPSNRIADEFLRLFVNRMKPLGYKYYEVERIHANNRPLYRLVFFSKHQMGVKIWQRVSLKKPDNQKFLDFQ